MAPIPVPTPANYDILGNEITFRPHGTDDWDNFQTVMNYVAGLPAAQRQNVRYKLAPGKYYFSYQVSMENASNGIMESSGATLVWGTALAPIRFLDAPDRQKYNPTAHPSLFVCHEAPVDPTQADMLFRGITMEGTDAVGYQGAGNGFPNHKNLGVEAAVKMTPAYPCVMKLNQIVDLTGLAPVAVPGGELNISDIFVTSLPDRTDLLYEEGVDYTADSATATITRLPAGSIPPGNVYVHFNNVANYGGAVSTGRVRMENCTIRGKKRIVDGVPYNNCTTGVMVQAAITTLPKDAPEEVEHRVTYSEDLPGNFWNTSFETTQLINGSFELDGVVIEDCGAATNVWMFQGVPDTPTDVTFAANARPRALVSYKNCTFRRCGTDEQGFAVMGHYDCAGIDLEMDNVVVQSCMGALWLSSFETDYQFLGGKTGGLLPFNGPQGTKSNTLRVGPKGVKVFDWKGIVTEFGRFILPCVILPDFGIPETLDPHGLVISGFEIERRGTYDFSFPNADAINIGGTSGVACYGNTIRTAGGASGDTCIRVSEGDNVTIGGNDMTGYQLSDGQANVEIEADCVGTYVSVSEFDLVHNHGDAAAKISGGILEP